MYTYKDFKTIEGFVKYYETIKNKYAISTYCNKITIPDNETNIGVTKLIENECDEHSLLKYGKKYYHDVPDQDILKYAIKKSYIKIIDLYAKHTPAHHNNIIKYVCSLTDNVDLFKKYYTGTNVLVCLCSSLLFENKPSDLTNYILNNYNWTETTAVPIKPIIFLHTFKIDNCDLIKFIVTEYKIKFDDVDTSLLELKCPTLEDYKEIMETLLINSGSMINMNNFMRKIVDNSSVDIIKYFIEKYYTGDLFNLVKYADNLEKFKYFIDIIGIENFSQDYFNVDKFFCCYDILEWLFDNGFNINIDIEDFDYDIMFLILKNMIKTNNFEYIKKNTRNIMRNIFSQNNVDDLFEKLINLEHMSIILFDLDIIFEFAIVHAITKIVDQLLIEFEPKNIDDIVHDLKLLKNDSMLEYINTRYFI